jgi:uracil-DNA glycosylase
MKTYFDYYTINASNKIAKNPKVSEMGLDRLRSEFELTKPFAVVALGRYAALAAKKASLEFFELPHPSGLNRKLNDKTYVRGVLKECSEYLSERLG